MLLLLANGAAQDRQWQTAYRIASQLDDVLPQGALVSEQPIGVRDKYTSLAFLAGSIALDRRTSRRARCRCSTATPAPASRSRCRLRAITAGRAAQAAGRHETGNTYYQQAAAYPELFYASLRSSASAERCRRHTMPCPSMSRRCSSALHSTAAHWSRHPGTRPAEPPD